MPSEISLSLGTGISGSKFKRSYEGDAVIKEFSCSMYAMAGTTLSMNLNRKLGFHIDIRYLYSPTNKFDRLNSELSIRSFMAGIGVYYFL
jgi:hypothetical protein